MKKIILIILVFTLRIEQPIDILGKWELIKKDTKINYSKDRTSLYFYTNNLCFLGSYTDTLYAGTYAIKDCNLFIYTEGKEYVNTIEYYNSGELIFSSFLGVQGQFIYMKMDE